MCDIGYIVKDHVLAIMQLLTHVIPQYRLQLQTTKCLNTAVMLMYLFLGTKAFHYTSFCDVPVVQERYKRQGNASLDVLKKFEKELLATRCKRRELYYVMLTDGYLTRPGASASAPGPKIYFPGHVFVVEKLPSCTNCETPSEFAGRLPRFNLYQSYVLAYELGGHIANNSSLACSYERMQSDILPGLRRAFENPVWTAQDAEFWKRFTFVDGSEWNDAALAGTIFFCYTKVTTSSCVVRLRKFLLEKRGELRDVLDKKKALPGDVYGMWNCHGEKRTNVEDCYCLDPRLSAKPLTCAEMLAQIDAMLAKV